MKKREVMTMIQVANPIYDIVFKYLMEDKESAMILLSTIIGEEIVDLDFMPQEYTLELQKYSMTVYRLDFSAKIKTKDNEYKKVLIELQKAKFAADIMRFRRYLGEQYRNKTNVFINEDGKNEPLPILSIYFLGYKLEKSKSSIIQVQRKYYDLITGKEIKIRDPFIECLTHDSFVVQIPFLKEPCKSDLEFLLSLFNQNNAKSNGHILELDESKYPEKFKKLIRRLNRAVAEQQIRDTMDAEDDIVEEFENFERLIEKKDKTIEEKDKALGEKDKALGEKDKALGEKDRALEKQTKLIEELKAALKAQQT